MKSSLTVMRPLKHRSKSAITSNMFEQTQKLDELPAAARQNRQAYDYVGPLQFRKKLISKYASAEAKPPNKEAVVEAAGMNQTANSKNPFNSTINRNTVLSSLHREQQIEITKQSRNLERYREYQQAWQRKKDAIKSQTKKRAPLLMENTIKSLYIHPNQEKTDVINNFIVHYWEMSLRNNHPILERHIKGHHFEKVEKEQLLQLREGIKKIEDSIPILPIERLGRLRQRQLSVSGRNKVKKEIESTSQFNTTRYSVPSTARGTQEEVYKISYEGDKRWMGTENL